MFKRALNGLPPRIRRVDHTKFAFCKLACCGAASGGGPRSAGRAMAASPSGKGIPWHRVVGHGGKLLIREPYASLQRKLLESEGVHMTERRVNMKLHAWTRAKEESANKKRMSRKR